MFIYINAERLPVKVFTSADGLGSSFISYPMRDSRGFLWFCTRDGLSRFDGQRFVTYQVGTKDAPPGIEFIYETRQGIYWIATTGGIYRFDPKTAAKYIGDQPILNAEFVSERRGYFYEDKAGKLWFISNDLNLLVEKDGKVTFQKVELNLPENRSTTLIITDFRQMSDDSLLIVTSWGLVRLLPDGRKIFYSVESTLTDLLTAVLEDRSGNIWLARSSGIYVFKPEPINELTQFGDLTVKNLDTLAEPQTDKQVRLPEKSGEIFKLTAIRDYENTPQKYLFKSADGHIWISTSNHIIEFDGRRFRSFNAAQGITGGIGRMVEDLNGNLYLGGEKGLVRLDRRGLTTYDMDDGLETLSILVINESRDGKLYTSGYGFLVSLFDGEKFETIRPPLPMTSRSLWTSNPVFQDSQNEWWFLTTESLYRFADSDNFLSLARQQPLAGYDDRDGLNGNQMYRIFEDKQNVIWISTRAAPGSGDAQSGLSKFNRDTQTFRTFSTAENYPVGKSVSAFAEDGNGNLWIGFYEGGLARFANGRFTEIASNLPEGLITALHMDKKGRLWLSSSNSGLSRFDDLTKEHLSFVSYTTENGLSSNNVRSITEDNFGQIYVGTARGIDRLSTETKNIKHYSINDGLAGDFVNVAFRDRTGNLWFGTPGGLSRLVPAEDMKLSAPPVWLSGLRIAGEHRPVSELGSKEISIQELAPAQNNLQIDFFGLDFSPNKSLRYQFMLEGADKEWSAPTEQRTVNYANLSAGTYRFLVRAINADGIVSEKPAIVSFKLLPPVWKRWWFIAAILLLVSTGVFALDRFRVKKTREVKTALKQTTESETRYRTLAETASDAIITIDENSKIVYINEAVEKMFGYKTEEIIGEQLTKLMPERFRASHEAGLTRYLTTNKKHIEWAAVELPGKHKSGVEIPLELSFGEFEKDGERFFTGIARDISERKKAEAALKKAREERFAELERVRKRIATDLHDDIGSSLTQISLLSEVVNQRIGTDEKPITKPLAMIADASRELVDSMSDIVWAINPKKDNLSDLTGRMRRFASDVLTAGNIKFNWHTTHLEKDIPVGANVRREIYLIFKESINNIVKHSGCTEADIELHFDNENLRLILRDNGKGFDTSGKSDGHGLTSMSERAAGLGGEVQIVSQPEKGTVITLKVPLEQHLKSDKTETRPRGSVFQCLQ